jgi:hypothetical protein
MIRRKWTSEIVIQVEALQNVLFKGTKPGTGMQPRHFKTFHRQTTQIGDSSAAYMLPLA